MLQTNSIARAIGAARFFAPHLGSECAAIRCRLVNRLFAAEVGRLEELMKILDQNVTVIDPREVEAALGQVAIGRLSVAPKPIGSIAKDCRCGGRVRREHFGSQEQMFDSDGPRSARARRRARRSRTAAPQSG